VTAPVFLGAKCAQRRAELALSQADLAAGLGTHRPRISLWERGVEQPQVRYLPALAATLRVDALSLLDVDEQDPPLAALRMAAGLTVPEVVQATGIPYSTYYRVESGNVATEPSPRLLRVIAETLRTSAGRLELAAARSRRDRVRDRVPALRA
jgi:transcriptional regulator with XRE-family HTH domain